MNSYLTPRELAQVIDVSESSVKRWIDDDLLQADRTPGGHRRIDVREAVQFVRTSRQAVRRPELLGLAVTGQNVHASSPAEASEQLIALLVDGDGPAAEALVMTSYLEGSSLAEIFDDLLGVAMQEIGELWHNREDGVFREHRATQICIEVLHGLRALQTPSADAPTAVGGAGPMENHGVPSLMCSIVLAAEGYRAVNLGALTPVQSLLQSLDETHPAIVWLTIGMEESAKSLATTGFEELVTACERRGASLVVGGRSAPMLPLDVSGATFRASSMRELAAFARGSRAAHSAGPASGQVERVREPR